jgi:hypothetical protein
MTRLWLALIFIAAYVLPTDAQSVNTDNPLCSDVDYGSDTACSLTGVNGSCTLIVDRMRAATPPTIYVRRGKTVTVKVINRSPLEELSLDRTAINTQIPIDSVQAVAPLLTVLGQFALSLAVPPNAVNPLNKKQGEPTDPRTSAEFVVAHTPDPKDLPQIQKEHKLLSDYIRADSTVDPDAIKNLAKALSILRALLVPPLDACNPKSKWILARKDFATVQPALDAAYRTINDLVGDPAAAGAGGAGKKLEDDATALAMVQADIDTFATGMAASQKTFDDDIADRKSAVAELQKKIAEEQKKRHPDTALIDKLKAEVDGKKSDILKEKQDAIQAAAHSQVDFDRLKANQAVLADALAKAQTLAKTVLFPAEIKLQALSDAIASVPVSSADQFKITDALRKDKNDQQEVFTLNAVNDLTDPVKKFIASAAADPFSQALTDSIVTTPPTKTAVMQVTVQYVTQPEMEVTAGVLVPFLPYKSYTAAPQSAGSATLVAQENHTYTIVPTVNLNFRLGNDQFAGNKRYGWFATVAVGYNPATTMVEFGVGPSVAVKSMVFSFLADVGRDTELASGFTVNQPLPGVATTPATNGVWSVKPSLGFSIRLPFNSGGGH